MLTRAGSRGQSGASDCDCCGHVGVRHSDRCMCADVDSAGAGKHPPAPTSPPSVARQLIPPIRARLPCARATAFEGRWSTAPTTAQGRGPVDGPGDGAPTYTTPRFAGRWLGGRATTQAYVFVAAASFAALWAPESDGRSRSSRHGFRCQPGFPYCVSRRTGAGLNKHVSPYTDVWRRAAATGPQSLRFLTSSISKTIVLQFSGDQVRGFPCSP